MFLSSWRVLLPVTLRHSKEPLGSSGVMLHRFLATPTEVRSLRASRERPRSVRASRRPRILEAGGEAEPLQGVDQLGGPLGRHAHESGELLEGYPGASRR